MNRHLARLFSASLLALVAPAAPFVAHAEEPAAPAPDPAPDLAPAPSHWSALRLAPHFDVGFGMPTGFLGASLELRHERVSVEAGAGMGFGGPQWMVQAWAHLFPVSSEGGFAIGLGHSQGAVQSKGDLGGIFGPGDRYDNAKWLNVLIAPQGRIPGVMDDGGPILRLVLGAAINLDPTPRDDGRMLFVLGMTFGWDFGL